MATKSDPRSSRRWRRVRAAVLATQPPCSLCGGPIDYAAHWLAPSAPQVDHVIPISRGGAPFDPGNLRATHRRCNQRRGNGQVRGRPRTSRPW